MYGLHTAARLTAKVLQANLPNAPVEKAFTYAAGKFASKFPSTEMFRP